MARILIAAVLLACGAAFSQQPVPVLAASDFFSCFTTVEGGVEATRVPVSGQTFSEALHIKTLRTSANPWDTRVRCFQTRPARKGDTILATFWMRATSAPGGSGFTSFVVEKGADPWTKSAEWTTGAKSEWKKVEIPFSMLQDFNGSTAGPNSYNISFWVNFGPQEIEIGGLTILNYGQNVPFSSLGLANWPYEGHAPDAPWRASATERIERIRKADIAVVVRDDQGNAVPDAAVHVRMKRHSFGFGSAVAGQMLMQPSADQDRYRQAILKMFNKVVLENDLKWPFWEEKWGYALPALDWLHANGIADIRGHNLIWPGAVNLPQDVAAMLAPPVDKEKLRTRIHDHFRDIMNATSGKLTEWDVLNEPYTNKDVQAVLGDAEMAVWFQWARELDPAVKLFVNDYNIVEAGGYDIQHQDGLYQIVQGIFGNGGPVDGIGLQSHFNMNLTPPDRVIEILDRFAGFGKDLEVTEFDINIPDEQAQADYTRDFLTAAFSHPAIKGFLMWGFWEGAHWSPDAALIRRDWSTKKNYDAWMELIYKQWWTDVRGTAGPDGVFRTRGFLGDYEVEIAGQTVPLKVERAQPNYALAGKQRAGSFTADGVVNAASFAKGPVAPGEIVEIWGQDFGPPGLASGAYESGQLATFGGDTRVFFDGVAAPFIHAMPGRVAAIVPYSASGATKVQVEHLGTKSTEVTLPVAGSAPGIFCAGGGTQAVAVNWLNGQTALNGPDQPASKGPGAFLTIFITGEGQTDPPGVDGKLPVYPANPRPLLPLSVKIGGVECPVDWKGLVYAGVMQINVNVPADVPSGMQPLTVTVGGVPAQSGVTVVIR